MSYHVENFDVVVIGAGHAGIEAALASARLGRSTALFTSNLDAVGNMPCNPCIGGSAKGQLVRKIDALGGEMAKAADATFIQSRMLGRGRGPAMHSPRVQSDRRRYQIYMKHALEKQQGLALKQAEIVEILTEGGAVSGVRTKLGAVYGARAVIVATGTFLRGRIIIGDTAYESGPDGMHAAVELSDSLRALGVRLMRFKTGTPARVNRRSLDFSRMQVQPGDEPIVPLSFGNEGNDIGPNRVVCHLTYTNPETHRIIRENLHRSPLFSGMIEGIGPRYCPSIEDKVVRFADKDRHQIFLEPMGLDTEEMYVQGLSSSLPEDVQLAFMRTMAGLEQVEVMRPAYAIEYDCADPLQLDASLEFKEIPGLYGAGQFNGTSGYEEAAAQGLMAGINAARRLKGLEPVILPRSSSYIGTLIDDLVTKGTNEPYRMMTSRSEYRLLLRQDNADWRLSDIGWDIGLLPEERYRRFSVKKNLILGEIAYLKETTIAPSEELNAALIACGTTPITTGVKMAELLRRPQVGYEMLRSLESYGPLKLPPEVVEEIEIMIKYEGYIERQRRQAEQAARTEGRLLPPDIDYLSIHGLRLEARQKLDRVRPRTLGQAMRISGVSPADISVLLVWLEQRAREEGRQ